MTEFLHPLFRLAETPVPAPVTHGFKANGTGPDRRAVDRLEMVRCLLGLDWNLELLDGAIVDEVSGSAGINHGYEARLVLDWKLDWMLDWMLDWVLDWMRGNAAAVGF